MDSSDSYDTLLSILFDIGGAMVVFLSIYGAVMGCRKYICGRCFLPFVRRYWHSGPVFHSYPDEKDNYIYTRHNLMKECRRPQCRYRNALDTYEVPSETDEFLEHISVHSMETETW